MQPGLDCHAQVLGRRLAAIGRPYLTEEAEADLCRGVAAGLSPEDVERRLLLACRRRGVLLERVLLADFRLQVQAVLGDRFLDEGERRLLADRGLAHFAAAADPRSVVDKVLHEVVATLPSERAVWRDLAARLGAQARVERSAWEAALAAEVRAVAARGLDVAEVDLAAILDRFRVESRIEIYERRRLGVVPIFLVAALLAFLACWGVASLLQR